MRLSRRLIPWTFRLGVLAAVGVAAFVLVRYRPRCTIRGDLDLRAISGDGSLVLVQPRIKPGSRAKPSLQVWDSRTGKRVHSLVDDVVAVQPSHDGRHGVAIVREGELRLFDWQTGEDWPIAGVTPKSMERASFSPRGRWLAVVGTLDTRLVSIARPTVVHDLVGTLTRFSADDRFAFTDRWRQPGPHVYHLDPFEPTAMGRVFPWRGFVADICSDGSLLALRTDRWEPTGEHTEKRTALTQIWNMELVRRSWPEVRDQRVRKLLEQPRLEERFTLEHFGRLIVGHEGAEHRRRFSPCGRFFAAWLPNYPAPAPLEIVETDKGRRATTFNAVHIRDGGFSADGSLFWLLHGDLGLLTVLDAASAKARWEMPCSDVLCFCPATSAIICRSSQEDAPAILDLHTGAHRGVIPRDFTITGHFRTATPGGSRIALAGALIRTRPPEVWEKWLEGWLPELFAAHRPSVLVLDTSSGAPRFRALCRDFEQVWLAADGRTLVTVHRDAATGVSAARVWDVEPHRAWTWATASVLAAAATWTAMRCWRRFLRRAPARADAALQRQ